MFEVTNKSINQSQKHNSETFLNNWHKKISTPNIDNDDNNTNNGNNKMYKFKIWKKQFDLSLFYMSFALT